MIGGYAPCSSKKLETSRSRHRKGSGRRRPAYVRASQGTYAGSDWLALSEGHWEAGLLSRLLLFYKAGVLEGSK